jgi:hypothetical protein
MHGIERTFKFENGEKIKVKFKIVAIAKKRKSKKKWRPVVWKGTINDKEIKIVQLSAEPAAIEDFDWKEFPKKYEVVKAYIADAIEEYFTETDPVVFAKSLKTKH